MDEWRRIWGKRRVPTSTASVLEVLIRMDGFDVGAGKIGAADWLAYVDAVGARAAIRPGASIFEVGCGSGAFLYPFYQKRHRVAGLDYSAALIDQARAVMTDMDFRVGEAAALRTEPRYDHVTANSVFHYFPDSAYAAGVAAAMIEKAIRSVIVLEVPDLSRREESEAARRDCLPEGEYENKYRGLDHLYFDRGWFRDLGARHGCSVEIFDQDRPDYANGRFRFNCIVTRRT